MKKLFLQTGCRPFYDESELNKNTTVTLLAQILQGCAQINDSSIPIYIDIFEEDTKTNTGTDSGAVMYIVAVLVFYSAGIVTMIVKYLRREKRELEEEKILQDFFRSMPAYKKEREQNNVNRVAIQAFHALTSFSYDDVDVDIDCSDEEVKNTTNLAETIHEVENEHFYHSNVDFSRDFVENGSVDDTIDSMFDSTGEGTYQCSQQSDHSKCENESLTQTIVTI